MIREQRCAYFHRIIRLVSSNFLGIKKPSINTGFLIQKTKIT